MKFILLHIMSDVITFDSLPDDLIGVIMRICLVNDIDFDYIIMINKRIAMILCKITTMLTKSRFECKVCHYAYCTCTVKHKIKLEGCKIKIKRYDGVLVCKCGMKHSLRQYHEFWCNCPSYYDLYIRTLDGVCLYCLTNAKKLKCKICGIEFMSTYCGKNIKCPKCLTGDNKKTITTLNDLPFIYKIKK